MDFLLFNIGNTHTQGVYSDAAGNFSAPPAEVETAAWMSDLSLLPKMPQNCRAWVSCVVPEARRILSTSALYSNLYWVDAASAHLAGLDFSKVDTSTLGADRIANAASLMYSHTLPAANFDCGTAITLEIVLDNGVFAGGAIMPGRKLMRKSLACGTAALPELPLNVPVMDTPGVNTLQALALGIDRGAVGMVRELMQVAASAGAEKMVVSGGDAEFFADALPQLDRAGKEFTLRGIYFIAAKHAEKE